MLRKNESEKIISPLTHAHPKFKMIIKLNKQRMRLNTMSSICLYTDSSP